MNNSPKNVNLLSWPKNDYVNINPVSIFSGGNV